ncbi:MAG: CHRD domain-containing protein [Pseudomonadota bacterium]
MRVSISRRNLMWLSGLALAGAMTLAQAAPLSFTVPLSGAQEVPPVETKGSGAADLTYDPGTRLVTWTVTISGLSSEATMAHFHGPAATGKNAGVKVWLSGKGAPVTSPLKGQATLSPADAQEFLAGEMYINVHTKDHPAGEIRGQVLPPKSN